MFICAIGITKIAWTPTIKVQNNLLFKAKEKACFIYLSPWAFKKRNSLRGGRWYLTVDRIGLKLVNNEFYLSSPKERNNIKKVE